MHFYTFMLRTYIKTFIAVLLRSGIVQPRTEKTTTTSFCIAGPFIHSH